MHFPSLPRDAPHRLFKINLGAMRATHFSGARACQRRETRCRTFTAQEKLQCAPVNINGEISTDVFSSASRGFMADNNSASGQQVIDDSQAERKSTIQPDGTADYLNWEVMTAIEGILNLAHAA
jgi:hypothetical protein